MVKIEGRIYAVEVDDNNQGFKINIEAKITPDQWADIIMDKLGERITFIIEED